MTETPLNQPTSQQPGPQQSAPEPKQSTDTPAGWKKLVESKRPVMVNLFNKFYSNKKVFWPVSIFLGLVILIVVLGLLFGKKGNREPLITTQLPTPTPFVRATPQVSSENSVLYESKQQLEDLKDQIRTFDVKQTKLQPPTLNFDIKF